MLPLIAQAAAASIASGLTIVDIITILGGVLTIIGAAWAGWLRPALKNEFVTKADLAESEEKTSAGTKQWQDSLLAAVNKLNDNFVTLHTDVAVLKSAAETARLAPPAPASRKRK